MHHKKQVKVNSGKVIKRKKKFFCIRKSIILEMDREKYVKVHEIVHETALKRGSFLNDHLFMTLKYST